MFKWDRMSDTTWIHRKHGFDPVVDCRTRLLILGSLPGDISLRTAQYYGNPQNKFWALMAAVTGVDLVSLDYDARLNTLLRHGVGLWDVVATAERSGSLDANIRSRTDNDLLALLARYPNVRALAFNGGTAARLGIKKLGSAAASYRILELPSSSPAFTLPFNEKLARWRPLGRYLAQDAGAAPAA
jgi:hypoxanthine-DNA glycosylase